MIASSGFTTSDYDGTTTTTTYVSTTYAGGNYSETQRKIKAFLDEWFSDDAISLRMLKGNMNIPKVIKPVKIYKCRNKMLRLVPLEGGRWHN